MIKIWVDDRNGAVEKLKPNLYRAIIDEAHRHGIRVMATSRRSRCEGSAARRHRRFRACRSRPGIDQELIAMLRERPAVFFVETLWASATRSTAGSRPGSRSRSCAARCPRRKIEQLGRRLSTSGSTDSAQRLLRNVSALNRAGSGSGLAPTPAA